MRYVVTYDVAEDRARAKVAERLEEAGFRVQESVFECDLRAPEIEALVGELADLIAGTEGSSVRAYRVCHDCLGASLQVATAGADREEADGACFVE